MTVEALSPWVQLEEGCSSPSRAFVMPRQWVHHVMIIIISICSPRVLKAEFNSALMLQGVGHRLRGSANAVRIRAPQIGGEEVSWTVSFIVAFGIWCDYDAYKSSIQSIVMNINCFTRKRFRKCYHLEPSHFTELLMITFSLPKTKIIH